MTEIAHEDLEISVHQYYNGMCSTLIIHRLSNGECRGRTPYNSDYDWITGYDDFCKEIKKTLGWLGSKDHLKYFDSSTKGENWSLRHVIPQPEHTADQYAFVICSTDQEQKNVRRHLKKLGFDQSRSTHNTKNGTWCRLHSISVKKLLKALESK